MCFFGEGENLMNVIMSAELFFSLQIVTRRRSFSLCVCDLCLGENVVEIASLRQMGGKQVRTTNKYPSGGTYMRICN